MWKHVTSEKQLDLGRWRLMTLRINPLKNATLYCFVSIYFFEPWFEVQILPILAALPANLSTHLFNKTTNFNRRLLGASLIYTIKLNIYNKKSVKIH